MVTTAHLSLGIGPNNFKVVNFWHPFIFQLGISEILQGWEEHFAMKTSGILLVPKHSSETSTDIVQTNVWTRLHSSRMHTARSLTVSPSMLCSGGRLVRGGGLVQGGACLVRGVPAWSQGGAWSGGACLVGGCLPGPGGCLPGPGGCLPGPGGGGWYPSMHWGKLPPVDRILDTCFWKYYLAPNFVCGR